MIKRTTVELDYQQLRHWALMTLHLQREGRHQRVSDRLEKFLHRLECQPVSTHNSIDQEIKDATT